MSGKQGTQRKYVEAVAFASAALRKDRQSLTRRDLERALRAATGQGDGDIVRSLRVLISFPGLRDLYCRGPGPDDQPKRGGRPTGPRRD